MRGTGELSQESGSGSPTTKEVKTTASLADGIWKHVVAISSKTHGMRLFIDGELIDSHGQYFPFKANFLHLGRGPDDMPDSGGSISSKV